MSFNLSGGSVGSKRTKITGSTVTSVYAPTSRTIILSIVCTENSGSTPNLTLEVYDGTTSWYLRKAVAMTAGTAFIFNEPFELPLGSSLRVTSSDASGKIDVHVSYINPTAAAGR